MNEKPGIKLFNDVVNRAYARAGAAGVTGFDHFQTYLFRNLVFEMGIHFIQEDLFHGHIFSMGDDESVRINESFFLKFAVEGHDAVIGHIQKAGHLLDGLRPLLEIKQELIGGHFF